VSQPTVTFVGNLGGGSQSPNIDSVWWFVDDIWSIVRREVPLSVLRIVGPIFPALREQLSSREGVRVDGFVPSVAEVLAASSLSIAPIRFGTGTRVKILESMAQGCPVVSTTKGCEGIAAQPGRDLLIGDDPGTFAAQCVRLLVDKGEQARLAAMGHALVRACYDRSALQPRLADLFGSLIEKARSRRLKAR
jgi:polysaccharide biosynthesis protein PslH